MLCQLLITVNSFLCWRKKTKQILKPFKNGGLNSSTAISKTIIFCTCNGIKFSFSQGRNRKQSYLPELFKILLHIFHYRVGWQATHKYFLCSCDHLEGERVRGEDEWRDFKCIAQPLMRRQNTLSEQHLRWWMARTQRFTLQSFKDNSVV